MPTPSHLSIVPVGSETRSHAQHPLPPENIPELDHHRARGAQERRAAANLDSIGNVKQGWTTSGLQLKPEAPEGRRRVPPAELEKFKYRGSRQRQSQHDETSPPERRAGIGRRVTPIRPEVKAWSVTSQEQ